MKKINIAIDGTSSTGKSTLAKQIANKLNYIYIDSGAMYRCVTLFAIQNNWLNGSHFDKESLIESLPDIHLKFALNKEKNDQTIFLNGIAVEDEIRSMEVSNAVSRVAAVPEIRRAMVRLQHEFGKDKGVVMDGRDIGTVVFPNAELKLFLTCSPEVRAQRRYEEMQQKGISASFEQVLSNIKSRDHLDSSRADSPLIKASDALEINTENRSVNELLDHVLKLIAKKS
ncbi:MAG: (d)CMP kinase [Flavobacteriaceae bacterium]|nr:(d)CMP kinase [Flavobacteriaceae bacterium]MDG2315106.1 (d)CMP kinase [Flavobacteriaceae bacterium]